MSEWQQVVVLTLCAGLAIPVGGVLAACERLLPGWLDTELRHWVMAFGAGALVSAVALVLVPEGIEQLSMPWVTVCFGGGALAFLGVDYLLSKSDTPASQMTAMLSDFVPEALALGAAFVADPKTAGLLALIMALQNLPEGFNAYREMSGESRKLRGGLLGMFVLLALLGPVCGLIGHFLLADQPRMVAAIMLFGAGGILYLVFQDLAPQARLERHWAPPLGAIAGFLLGIIGHMMIH